MTSSIVSSGMKKKELLITYSGMLPIRMGKSEIILPALARVKSSTMQ